MWRASKSSALVLRRLVDLPTVGAASSAPRRAAPGADGIMNRRAADARRYPHRRLISERIVLLFLVQLTFLAGCGRATPAAFWGGYRPELIEQKFSDQGPWGGVRWIRWVAQTEGTFRVSDVVSFAEVKGWSCREP